MKGERSGLSQSPRDRVLWLLNANTGRMERSKLRCIAGMRYVLLDRILADLAKKSRIRVEGKMISLVSR